MVDFIIITFTLDILLKNYFKSYKNTLTFIKIIYYFFKKYRLFASI